MEILSRLEMLANVLKLHVTGIPADEMAFCIEANRFAQHGVGQHGDPKFCERLLAAMRTGHGKRYLRFHHYLLRAGEWRRTSARFAIASTAAWRMNSASSSLIDLAGVSGLSRMGANIAWCFPRQREPFLAAICHSGFVKSPALVLSHDTDVLAQSVATMAQAGAKATKIVSRQARRMRNDFWG